MVDELWTLVSCPGRAEVPGQKHDLERTIMSSGPVVLNQGSMEGFLRIHRPAKRLA